LCFLFFKQVENESVENTHDPVCNDLRSLITFNRSNEVTDRDVFTRIVYNNTSEVVSDVYVFEHTPRVEDLNDRGNGRKRCTRTFEKTASSHDGNAYTSDGGVRENGGKSFFDLQNDRTIRRDK